ncbi:homoserine kinase-like [Tripterygium wilfordii]|uniref:Homoserine kinase-like n=1 Tax=Tripterygium wilfordii TaxID=458696 RepID=A0A7J7DXK0_TRIWF|nr:homoserine kinase-like [Tripterygium wilfordii]
MAICFQSRSKPTTFFPSSTNTNPKIPSLLSFQFRCNFSLPTLVVTEPEPVFTSVEPFAPATIANLGPGFDCIGCAPFAPATIANLGPGFDCIGCAVEGLGDYVSVTVDPSVNPGEISISDISGTVPSVSTLSKNPLWNCAGISALAVMKMLNIRSVGLSLSLRKGLPLGSGLGSSAASAAAAAVAVNELFGSKLSADESWAGSC